MCLDAAHTCTTCTRHGWHTGRVPQTVEASQPPALCCTTGFARAAVLLNAAAVCGRTQTACWANSGCSLQQFIRTSRKFHNTTILQHKNMRPLNDTPPTTARWLCTTAPHRSCPACSSTSIHTMHNISDYIPQGNDRSACNNRYKIGSAHKPGR